MDWAATGQGNRNPCVTVNGVLGFGILHLSANVGDVVTLDASGSYDQEGDALSFRWWIQSEAGSLKQPIEIEYVDAKRIRIKLPKDSGGQHLHVICEVADNGIPALTSYRRVVVEILN